jgi:hypothetical protein
MRLTPSIDKAVVLTDGKHRIHEALRSCAIHDNGLAIA